MALPHRRLLLTLAGGLGLVGLTGAAASGPDLADQQTMGNPKAKVEVVEYASASCPHCARFATDVFPAFKKKYIDTGKVHFTFREVLTEPAPVAAAGFMIARCAGPGKYFTTLDGVFRSQKEWYAGADVRGSLLKVAQSQGMTEAQFEACISNEAAQKALNERVEKYTTKDNVDSTPTFFVNGKRLTGEQTLADLDKAIGPAAAPAAARKPAPKKR
jgi:protein-disulfide isomerase